MSNNTVAKAVQEPATVLVTGATSGIGKAIAQAAAVGDMATRQADAMTQHLQQVLDEPRV